MKHYFIGIEFIVFPRDPFTEILIAELSLFDFDSFMENDNGVIGYIEESKWEDRLLDQVKILNSSEVSISYTSSRIEQENWNVTWETHFEPIQVLGQVNIKAPFHNIPDLKYNIVIEPKMSFGTGHHETTHMMVEYLLETEVAGRKVLDMGCGTGILAIFAAMKGAVSVDAIDIDAWCYENSMENITRNECKSINVFQGDASLLNNQRYDIILANINRNILLTDLGIYAGCLNKNGLLLLSGFYLEDFNAINDRATENGLVFQEQKERNNWLSLKYLK